MKMFRFNIRFKGFHVVAPLLVMILSLNKRYAITVFPFVFYNNKYSRQHMLTYNHEVIHIHQQMECGLVGIILYLGVSWILGSWIWTLPILFIYFWIFIANYLLNIYRFKRIDAWYRMIMFEREAYNHANIWEYTRLRRPFDWLEYL